MTITPLPTMYHDDADGVRRDLMSASQFWECIAAEHRTSGAGTTGSLLYGAALTAGVKSYALAALIGYARQEFGEDVAHRLAYRLDDLLENGDDHDLNRDVTPAPKPIPAPRLVVVDEAS